MMGRVGAILSPYVARLGVLTGKEWLPMAVFAGAALLSGSLTLFLPETKGKTLPRTMDEAEKLGQSRTGGYQEIGSEDENGGRLCVILLIEEGLLFFSWVVLGCCVR